MKKESASNVISLSDAKEAQLFVFNKTHYGNVIRENRKKMGYTQQQVADLVGVSKNHVTNWEAGRARPDLNVIPALCKSLSISLPVFFGVPDAQDALSREEHQLVDDYRHLSPRDRLLVRTSIEKMLELSETELWERCRITFLPILHNYQQAAAGVGTPLDSATETYQTYIRRSKEAERADEIVTVNGSSMEPMFHHGQDVFVEHTTELAVGEIGLFVVNSEGFIKEWATDHLHSLNPEYPDIPLHEDDQIRCIGRILGAVDKKDYPTPEELVVLQELLKENAFGD